MFEILQFQPRKSLMRVIVTTKPSMYQRYAVLIQRYRKPAVLLLRLYVRIGYESNTIYVEEFNVD